MDERKKELRSVKFRPSSAGWYLHVETEEEIGFDITSSFGAKEALTANQINELIGEAELLIDERGKGNVPGSWRTLLKELEYGKAGE